MQLSLSTCAFTLKTSAKCRFALALYNPLVLVNDDSTRSFLALRVVEGEDSFLQTLRCVDKCMKRFDLPLYYEVRSQIHCESDRIAFTIFSPLDGDLTLCFLTMTQHSNCAGTNSSRQHCVRFRQRIGRPTTAGPIARVQGGLDGLENGSHCCGRGHRQQTLPDRTPVIK